MTSTLRMEGRSPHSACSSHGFVISRSKFSGGSSSIAHWLGDNYSKWDNMRWSIIDMLAFNAWGFLMVICGFFNDTTVEFDIIWL